LLATALCAAEITTGAMLGRHYDPRAFYVRNAVPSGPGESWQKTYSGPAYRREAQGKLMNIRLANALFLDEWMHERAFDPVTACSWSTSACKARKPDTTSPSTASIARTPIASAPAGVPM
jgi:hypothetical protein